MANAARIGFNTALATYREDTMSLTNYAYGEWPTRIARYELFDFYAHNTVYGQLNRYASTLRAYHNLYKHIRGIYNPVNRLIKLEAAKTYGGYIDWTGQLRTGAIPVEGADDLLIEAIIQVLKWSNFGTEKTSLVYQGAKYGDSFLKIIDDVPRSRVRLEILDPRDVKEAEFDAVGNVTRVVIEYDRVELDGPDKGKTYTYREEIDKEWVRTYKGNNLFAFHTGYSTDAITGETRLEPLAEWRNLYGFVPVRHIAHVKGSGDWGMTSFQTSLSKINELNDAASILQDGIRKTVNPVWALIGGRMPSGKEAGTTEKDEIPVVNVPAGGDVKPLVATIDVNGAITAINQIVAEIERDMPQLALQRIRESGGNPSGVAIENSYSDASDLLVEVQGNYDQGLIAAIQMAISIGALRYPTNPTAYAAFAPYDPVTSFESGELDFYIKEREVFSDRLTADRKIELLLQAASTPVRAIVMRDLGYSEDDIAEVEEGAREQQEASIAAGIRAAAQAAGMNTDEEDDEDPEAENDVEAIPQED